jgi:hypothetical protein
MIQTSSRRPPAKSRRQLGSKSSMRQRRRRRAELEAEIAILKNLRFFAD